MPAVTARDDVHAAVSLTAFHDAMLQRGLRQRVRPVYRLAVVFRPPRTTVNVPRDQTWTITAPNQINCDYYYFCNGRLR